MLPDGKADGGGQLWLCHRIVIEGVVAWLCRKQWAAGLVVGVRSLAAGSVAGPMLLLAMVVVAIAVDSGLLVVRAKKISGRAAEKSKADAGWLEWSRATA